MADTPGRRYEPHPQALAALHGDVENFARGQGEVLHGTAGSVLTRSNRDGFRYFTHQYYDADGRKVERYLAGPAGDAAAEAKAQALRDKIGSVKSALAHVRLLVRQGYKFVDSKTFATLAALRNHGLFEAGALLVGSHAYGVLLNHLGVRAAQYTTTDVDIARGAQLALSSTPDDGFLGMLGSSGIRFAAVPALNRKAPSTSFKEIGKSLFQVDLLVPSATDEVHAARVPELKAHATALPYLRYLLAEPLEAAVLAREGCCTVRLPAPERFALHKMIVSQLRRASGKSVKDVSQAAVLVAALAEMHPVALEEAAKAIPRSAKRHVRNAVPMVRSELGAAHPRANDFLATL